MQYRKNATDSSNSTTRIQRGVRRPVLVAALVLAAVAGTAQGQDSGTKTLGWDFNAKNINKVWASYKLVSRAYTRDTHGLGGNGPSGWQGTPVKGKYPVALGTAGATAAIVNPSRSSAAHPVATANATINAPAVVRHPGGQIPPRYTATATVTASGTQATNEAGADFFKASAKHKAKTTVSIRGAKVEGWSLRGTIDGITFPVQAGRGRPTGAINERGRSIHDPIVLTIKDIDTGDIWSTELFSLDVASSSKNGALALWNYDSNNGIDLALERNIDGVLDGRIDIAGSMNSDWIIDPVGEFGASLVGGQFSATGAWAGLPWDLTMDGGDVIAASLAAEYVPSSLSYTVPDAFINDDHTYSQSLAWDDDSDGVDYAENVPAPGSLVLLTMAAGLGLRRRRSRA